MLSMEEFYEMLQRDHEEKERWRKECPCCANCKYYEYDGSTDTDLCGYWDVNDDWENKTIYETKCGQWK